MNQTFFEDMERVVKVLIEKASIFKRGVNDLVLADNGSVKEVRDQMKRILVPLSSLVSSKAIY